MIEPSGRKLVGIAGLIGVYRIVGAAHRIACRHGG